MLITSIKLTNFRCFGPQPTLVTFRELTSLVGTNGCGKSAVLQALSRMFGGTQFERGITKDDFHVPLGKTIEQVGESSLSIEVRLDFPEIVLPPKAKAAVKNGKATSPQNDGAVSHSFQHMVVSKEGERPYCRILLEAKWTPSSSPQGEIEQAIYWVTTSESTVTDIDKVVMRNPDRSRIQVLYVPATRDPEKQIRQISGSLIHHILSAVRWSPEVKKKVEEASKQLNKDFSEESGVEELQKSLQGNWTTLHPGKTFGKVDIRPTSANLDDLLKQVEAVFSPGPGESEYPSERLSDGQKSLFYLSVVGATFDLLGSVAAQNHDSSEESGNFIGELLNPPLLMLLAIEEPENHLAPHYLGRIISLLRKMSKSEHGQVVLTSHSSSIMSRIEPEEVRYLRLDLNTGVSSVKEILLPEVESDAYKYVREAVRAFPELYFARLIVLGEGDSEEIILPRIAQASNLLIDSSFVSIVPLGGRHVNHFWKLLSDLEIPYITLLDLDAGKDGAGFGRIKYALKQLLLINVPKDELLLLKNGKVLEDAKLEEMHTRKLDKTKMSGWLNRLEDYDVFFSSPLDLDFLMLEHFPDAYKGTANVGPSIPDDEPDYTEALEGVIKSVFKGELEESDLYDDDSKKLFFWYRYLFLTRGKPTSHRMAVTSLSDDDLLVYLPPVLTRLINRMKKLLAEHVEDEL